MFNNQPVRSKQTDDQIILKIRSRQLSGSDVEGIFIAEKRRLKTKRILIFIGVFLVLWLGVLVFSIPKAFKSVTLAKTGATELNSGLLALTENPDLARAHFTKSSQSLRSSANMLKSMSDYAKVLLALPQAQSSIHLMKTANYLAALGVQLSLIAESSNSTENEKTSSIETTLSQYVKIANKFIDKKKENLVSAIDYLRLATEEIAQVNSSHIPKNQRELFIYWQEKLPNYQEISNNVLGLINEKELIFGTKDQPKKYLILFQNDTELRPAGGFLGSYATLTIAGDEVTEFWVQKNIYIQDKAFVAGNKIPSPKPISERLTENWALRDANWALDFPEAAAKVAEFYQLEGGAKTDGVIAIDTTVIEDLLNLTGPIQVPGYDFTVDAESFVQNTQKQVELDYYEDPGNKKINQPKAYIDDLSSVIAAAIQSLDKEKKKELPKILLAALDRKSLMITAFDPQVGAIFKEMNIDGHIDSQTQGDYLYIANANIGGKKSSRNVEQKVSLQSTIDNEKSISHSLTIRRTHFGNGEWPDGDNRNWMQILLPEGAALSEQVWSSDDGETPKIEISQYSGKTLLSVWFDTKVGKEKSLTVKYKVPNVVKDNRYKLIVPKQPGAQNLKFQQKLSTPKKIRKLSGTMKLNQLNSTTLEATFPQDQDHQFEVEF